ncbi:hypothetical protein BD309DRAFT_987411 [Dichomitus squalens]|nr:hypothetical protein BD309DRAFT_987411 [Dichomitus squalens]
MSPSTLSPNVLHVLLQYISPPSQLTQPIPPHLLSKPLLQRHHFLHLTPEQPDEYLCWPSSPERKSHVLDLLETRFRPLDDDQPTVYPVQYSFDGEDFFAHVDISNDSGEGPRVIFQWDESGEWKYHNTDLMPFPPGSRAALEDVLVPPPPPSHVSVQPLSRSSYPQTFHVDDLQDDSDDDDYWNAYGSTDIGDSRFGQSTPGSAKDVMSSEDAYWAQYASVQGTADSTIPSPVPRRKPLAAAQQADSQKVMESPMPLPVPVRVPSEDTYAEPLPIPQGIMTRPRSNSRWDPADATTLAHLLSTISPRESPAPSPALDGQFDVDLDAEEDSSPTVGGSNDSDLVSPPALGLNGIDVLATAPVATCGPPVSVVGDIAGGGLVEGIGGGAVLAENEDEADLRAALQAKDQSWPSNRAMDDDNVTKFSDFTVWKRLLEDQTALFEKTYTKNEQLDARVEELERELSVWKEAFKTADGDRKVLNKTVLKLERSIDALKEDNPLILCLIDGDGNIFSSDLIKQGQFGGRQAAALLTKGLTDYLASVDPTEASFPGRGQIWLTIYLNKNGLLETLTSNLVCTAEEFEAFVLGFNQASPLFSIVDVGNGKEAADSKIKECLRVFTRFPQITRVFFGGAHDNGYTSTLNLLQNEGLLDKVVLLKGYKELAHEINSLRLPQLEVDGVFIKKKLQTNGKQKAAVAASSATNAAPATLNKSPKKQPLTPASSESETARQGNPSVTIAQITKPVTPVKKPRQLDPNQGIHVTEKPPPCNFFYLARCSNGDNCKYEHSYPLTLDQVAELRVNAKKWPCPAINNGNRCPLGDNCIMNHFCPKGPKCMFRKQGKCKFVGSKLPLAAPKKPRKTRVDQSKKRGTKRDKPPTNGGENADERPQKAAKVEGEVGNVQGLRRSARNRGSKTNYDEKGDNASAAARALPKVVSVGAQRAAMMDAPRDQMKRLHDPKTYGAIPGVPIGTWWETREACSKDAIHAPWVAGISPGPQGAYSIALSGGYEDDQDYGDGFTYTGSGGRDLKGTKDKPKNLRTAPQSCDQTFDNKFNSALKRSCETKKPVRVIRGFKLPSPYAPAEGYRYDGLYTVEACSRERGLEGYLVCKFVFKRVPGQPPFLTYGDDEGEDKEDEEEMID